MGSEMCIRDSINIVSVAVPDPGASDVLLLFKAPSDVTGGGITILAASAVNGASLAGAGTTFTYQLLKYSTAGTPAVNGTITNIIGSATQWTDMVPQAFTPVAGSQFVDAGEWVALDYAELNSANPTNSRVEIHYVMGR